MAAAASSKWRNGAYYVGPAGPRACERAGVNNRVPFQPVFQESSCLLTTIEQWRWRRARLRTCAPAGAARCTSRGTISRYLIYYNCRQTWQAHLNMDYSELPAQEAASHARGGCSGSARDRHLGRSLRQALRRGCLGRGGCHGGGGAPRAQRRVSSCTWRLGSWRLGHCCPGRDRLGRWRPARREGLGRGHGRGREPSGSHCGRSQPIL